MDAFASCALSRRRNGDFMFLEHQPRLLYLCPWRLAAGVQCIGALAPAFKRRKLPLPLRKPDSVPQLHGRFLTTIRASTAAGFDNNNNESLHSDTSSSNPQEQEQKQEQENASNANHGIIKGNKASLKAAAIVSGVTILGTLAAVSFTLASGGPAALSAAISKSGFFAAFALIFVSEIGDKTFFIAALLAMRHSRALVLLGSTGALSVMTIISVVIGRLFQKVPAQLQTSLPIGEYAAVGLLIVFGLRAIKSAWDLPSAGAMDAIPESGELAEAEEFVKQASAAKTMSTPMTILAESFSLVFLAEWGDRSMLATVALGAAQSPWGVASGAIVGHVLATSLAVLGGAFLAQYISEKVVGYTGGVLFLVFAAATLLGVF